MDSSVLSAERQLVTDVADHIVELMRSFGRARARILAAAAHDVEWSAHILLKTLQTDGPRRAGELADCVQVDPSTVSRQVAALVRDGLLERRADPADGRASLLVLTPKAEDVLADHARLRLDHFAHALRDWPAADLARFAELLARFTTAYDGMNADWLTRPTASATTDDPAPEPGSSH